MRKKIVNHNQKYKLNIFIILFRLNKLFRYYITKKLEN